MPNTRILELHGGKGEFCVETLAMWGVELCGPAGDEGHLVQMWRTATAPAPHLVAGLLENPVVAARVRAVLNEVVQEELRKEAEEAATS